MADDAAQAAAAAVLEDLTGPEPQMVRPDTSDLMGVYQDGAAAPADAGEQTAPVEPEPFALPSWDADVSGIEDLLDEPDDPPVGDEPEPYRAPTVQAEETWDDDEEKRQLKAQLVQAQKRLVWEQEQRTKAQEKDWRAEAGRRFPFSDPDSIKATSRRGFLRQAAEQHQRVEKKVKPLTDALEALREQTIVEARAQAKQEAAAAFGRPTVGPQAAQVQITNDEQQYDRRRFRSPHELIAAKLKGGQYGPV